MSDQTRSTHGRKTPNILWIGLDQIRADTPGCYGNPVCRTPNIDRLAAGGVLFERAYTPCSLCTPARASMLTGRFAFGHRMLTNCDLYHSPAAELPDPEMLLHPRLQQLGYRCGFVGKWHVGTEMGPVDYGFEGMNVPGYGNLRREPEFHGYLERRGLSYSIRPGISANPDEKTLLTGLWDGPVESTPPYYLAGRTIGLMEQYAAAGAPFLLTCQFWGPHEPHFPCTGFAGLHDREAIEPWINFEDSWDGKPEMIRRTHTDFYRSLPPTWREWREVVGSYYDQTAMIDAQIGRILDRLDELGLRESTVIILTSDHGDMTGSHGGMNDKGYLYEEAHRIPLIVSWPDYADTGARRGELVYNMDIFPTILDTLGLAGDALDGRSFLPLLRSRAGQDNGAGSRAGEPRPELLLEFHGIRFLYSQRAVVTDDGWKYIFTPGDRDEMYDLNTDPGELRNLLVDGGKDRAEDLRERMMRAAAGHRDPLQVAIAKFFGHWDRGGANQPEPSRI